MRLSYWCSRKEQLKRSNSQNHKLNILCSFLKSSLALRQLPKVVQRMVFLTLPEWESQILRSFKMGNFSLSSSSHTSSSKTDDTSAMTPELRINISQITLELNTHKFIVLYIKLFKMIEPCYRKKITPLCRQTFCQSIRLCRDQLWGWRIETTFCPRRRRERKRKIPGIGWHPMGPTTNTHQS